MKISIIYDNNTKGITYKSVQYILKEIHSHNINTSVKELFIPDDFNIINEHSDCFPTCLYYCSFDDNCQDCAYQNLIKRISSILNRSDLIILASSTSNHNIGSQMYMLLEHLSYQWLPHKLNSLMVNKIGLAISSATSLTIFSHANMTLSRILRFWGIDKHSIFSKSLSKYKAENLSEKNQKRLCNELSRLSLEIVTKYRKTSAVIIPNFNNRNSTFVNNRYKTPILKLHTDKNLRRKLKFKKFKNRKIL